MGTHYGQAESHSLLNIQRDCCQVEETGNRAFKVFMWANIAQINAVKISVRHATHWFTTGDNYRCITEMQLAGRTECGKT